MADAKTKGRAISKKQSAKFERARKHLRESRAELMKKYDGEYIFDDETKTNFVLRFSTVL